MDRTFASSSLSCLPLLIIYIILRAAFARYGQALVCMCFMCVSLRRGKSLNKDVCLWQSVAGFNTLCFSLWLILAGSFQSGSGSWWNSVDQGGHQLCVWTASLDLVTSSFLCSLQSCAFKVKLKKGMSALGLRCVLKDSSSVCMSRLYFQTSHFAPRVAGQLWPCDVFSKNWLPWHFKLEIHARNETWQQF